MTTPQVCKCEAGWDIMNDEHCEEGQCEECHYYTPIAPKRCKWLNADWCTNPKFKDQEKCDVFYIHNHQCPSYIPIAPSSAKGEKKLLSLNNKVSSNIVQNSSQENKGQKVLWTAEEIYQQVDRGIIKEEEHSKQFIEVEAFTREIIEVRHLYGSCPSVDYLENVLLGLTKEGEKK